MLFSAVQSDDVVIVQKMIKNSVEEAYNNRCSLRCFMRLHSISNLYTVCGPNIQILIDSGFNMHVN
jgi:hypothetical protein